MNANELANFLETDCWYKLITRQEIATMLRQQQAEIEALKAKELTDEEIIELFENPDDFSCIEFARAILRKAQEK
jgi:hypothetical protein